MERTNANYSVSMDTTTDCSFHDDGRHRWIYSGRAEEGIDNCERPHWMACLCREKFLGRCNRSARSVCGPCSESYRRRVGRIFQSGFTDRPTDRVLLATITAPGDTEHFLPRGDRCPCTPPEGTDIALYNATASKRFNRWMQDLRRQYGPVQYARAAEIQDGKRRRDGAGRGALHFHVLIRAERSGQILKDYGERDPYCAMRLLVEEHGFGHELDVQIVAVSTSWYCAKYVSKSADARSSMPWLDLETGELISGNGRYRTWTASREWGLTMKALRRIQRAWAQCESHLDEQTLAWLVARAVAAEGGALDLNTLSYTSQKGMT